MELKFYDNGPSLLIAQFLRKLVYKIKKKIVAIFFALFISGKRFLPAKTGSCKKLQTTATAGNFHRSSQRQNKNIKLLSTKIKK